MTESYTPAAFQSPVSGEYEQVLHWSITDDPSRFIRLQVMSIPLFILMGLIFTEIALLLNAFPGDFRFGLAEIVIVLISLVAAIVLHEVLHGLAMRLYGAHPQYGVLWKQGMVYATSPGYAFRRNSYIVVALAPLVVISLLAVGGMLLLPGTLWVPLLVLCAVINGSGAIGDLWTTTIVLRYPASAYIVDERDGIRVLIRKEQVPSS